MAHAERWLVVPAIAGLVMMLLGEGALDVAGLVLTVTPLLAGTACARKKR